MTVPDSWSTRWPDFDGVVWYRLTWQQASPVQATGLMLDHLNMAGMVYLNGALLYQDRNLVEPLTRAWTKPLYLLLSAPLLHAGENTLLVRISGLSAFQPGLGKVVLGSPQRVQAHYEGEYLVRHDLQLLSLSVSATLGCFFIVLWLLRRRESAYGWFGLLNLAWLACGINNVATSPWPFASTYTWEAMNTAALLLFSAAFALFVVRYFERRYVRSEIALLVLTGACAVSMFVMPTAYLEVERAAFTLVCSVIVLGSSCWFLRLAWQTRRMEHSILAVYMLAVIAADVHDLLVFLNVIHAYTYYAAIASNLLLVAMALILASRFTRSLQRIENFNNELRSEVETAKASLAATLQRQHDLEIGHARISERLNLVRDLHDGLGGMLVGNIAAMENAPGKTSSPHFLALLKEVRDDLRLIIETATSHAHGEHPLSDELVPLRHRLSNLLEANHIDCRWTVSGLDALYMDPSHSLEILRFLQEALTNVLKHSGASKVDITVSSDGKNLQLEVVDNGHGLEHETAPSHGAGMQSMRARAQRLGTELRLESMRGKMLVGLHLPGINRSIP